MNTFCNILRENWKL